MDRLKSTMQDYGLDESQAAYILEAYLGQALLRFIECDAESDFCVQHIGDNYVVFGSTNRIIHRLETGAWEIERSHCTPHFKEAWDRLYAEKPTH